MGGGPRFQTKASGYAHKAITIPANGAAATLQSLVGALDLFDSAGQNLGDIAKNLYRITGVRITAQAAAFLYGRGSAGAATVNSPTAPTDWELPVAAPDVLSTTFVQGTAGAVAATVLIFFD